VISVLSRLSASHAEQKGAAKDITGFFELGTAITQAAEAAGYQVETLLAALK
jgi:hypothetical protein